MKKTILILSALSIFLIIEAQQIQVMTFNIRMNTASDSLNDWPFRKDKVASQMLFHEVQLLGVQEALHVQMIDLRERLPQFSYIGVGRDDGNTKGEYSAIFYDATRLSVLNSATFGYHKHPK